MKNRVVLLLLFGIMFVPQIWGINYNSSHWTFDPTEYACDMNVHAALSFNGTSIDDYTTIELAAFSGNECRGVAKVLTASGKNYYQLRIYSRIATGDIITFKCYNSATNRELKVAEILTFDGEQHGTLSSLFQLSMIQPVTGVSLDRVTMTLNTTLTTSLLATVSPSDASNKSVTWRSSDPAVATVSDQGLVTGIKAGKATITVTTVDGGFTDNCEVTVLQPVTGVSLDRVTMTLNTTLTTSLLATVSPSDASNRSVTWRSSDPAVATVSDQGLVTGIKAGKATITVTTVDGGFTDNCEVTVLQPVMGIKLNQTEITLKITDNKILIATVSPSDASDKSVTWSSADEDIAVVNQNGKVTAMAVGETVITAITVNGAYQATCYLTVEPILAESVDMYCEEELLELTPKQKTLHFLARVLPENTTNKEILWSVEHGEDMATITQNGILQATEIYKDGTVTVRATVARKDGIYSEKTVEVKNFATGIYNPKSTQSVFISSPSKDYLILQGDINSVEHLYITDISGKTIMSISAQLLADNIDVSTLCRGIYCVVIRTKTCMIEQKVLIK